MLIKIKEIGRILGLRKVAKKHRERIENAIASGENIILDFEEVESVSSSFADELIAKLFIHLGSEKFKRHIIIENANDFIKIVIKATIRDRVKESA